MQTVYDWLTMAIFAGLIVLFLQRSQGTARDSLWHYLVAAIGCAVANQVGNEALKTTDNAALLHLGAIAIIAATIGFVWYYLRPFGPQRD